MTKTRDFLKADPTPDMSLDSLASLLTRQNDVLADIVRELRKQNANILASAVVRSTSQLSNSITDAYSHEVSFEVGGKPVPIYRLMAYSTYDGVVALSFLSMSKVNDGIPMIAGNVLDMQYETNSVYLQCATATLIAPVIVNGPSDTTVGGMFLYGFTIPDYDRDRNR